MSDYGVKDIKTLEGIEAIRLRPGIIDYCIEHQYELPRRLQYYAKYYPNVSFSQALELYSLSVREVIVLFQAKHLFDAPLSFGRGLIYARDKWLEKMSQAEKLRPHAYWRNKGQFHRFRSGIGPVWIIDFYQFL